MLRGRFTAASAVTALEEVQAIACARRTNPSRVALAWALAHAGVSSALIGVSSTEQLADLVGATTLDLSMSDIQRLDWRWKITGGNPPDDEDERPAATNAAVTVSFNNINELKTERLHA
jgi:aryl-alcohol dehydrogenase-like predicted oxidoreductase